MSSSESPLCSEDDKPLVVYGKLHPEPEAESVSTSQLQNTEIFVDDSGESDVSSLPDSDSDETDEKEVPDSDNTQVTVKEEDTKSEDLEVSTFLTSKYVFNVHEIKTRNSVETEQDAEEPAQKKQKLSRNWIKQSEMPSNRIEYHKFTDNCHGISADAGISPKIFAADIFSFFFDETLADYLIEEINKYAKQVISQYRDPLSKGHSKNLNEWKPATKGDMYTFIGLFLIMSVVRKTSFKQYWSTDPLVSTPFFPQVMSHNRFILMWTFFDFMDNGRSGCDKMKKFQVIFEHFVSRFQEAYRPGEHIGIKENFMLWKNRVVHNNVLKTKRTRFGIKCFELISCTNGYVYKSLLCTGRASDFSESDGNEHITDSAVMLLSEELQKTGRTLYLDVSHCSPELFTKLHSNGMNVIGPVSYNRAALPLDLNVYNIDNGESLSYVWNNLQCVIYNDITPTVMLSTAQKPNTESTKTNKPAVLTDYNKRMKSAPVIEDVTETFPALKRTYKCHKKLFLHMIDLCVHNAMCLYNEMHKRKMDYAEFRISVARLLFENYTSVRSTNTVPEMMMDSKSLLRLTGRHFPSLVPPTLKKLSPTRRCTVCSTHLKRRETRYRCAECNIGLCVQPCFQIYHEIKNF